MNKIIVKRKIISKKSRNGHPDCSMQFEMAIRQFLGKEAYHIADFASDPKQVKKYFIKVARKIIKDLSSIDTNPRHKSILILRGESLLRQIKNEHEGLPLILCFLSLVSSLLGYDFLDGKPFHNILFWQDSKQYFDTFLNMQKGNVSEYFDQEKNLWKDRSKLIKDLKNKGYDHFQLSIVFNTTEYDIRKTLKSF